MKTHLGLLQEDQLKLTQILNKYLADTYCLYLKTHNFHWNVTGVHFQLLHKLFDEQYNTLFLSLDLIAERIRALNEFVPTFEDLIPVRSLKETKKIPSDKEMIQILLDDHETVIRNLRTWISEIEKTLDAGTVDFLTSRIEEHEKTAWILRSHLQPSKL